MPPTKPAKGKRKKEDAQPAFDVINFSAVSRSGGLRRGVEGRAPRLLFLSERWGGTPCWLDPSQCFHHTQECVTRESEEAALDVVADVTERAWERYVQRR
jgi:hypothetical protein